MSSESPKPDFKSFFLDYFNAVVRFAASYLSDESECQDIAQEAFIRLYQSWSSVGSEEQARSFLYIAARNLCVSRIRRCALEEQFVLAEREKARPEEADEEFYSEVTYQEMLRLLHKAIGELPPQSRRIILLGLEGKNNSEIADLLGISVNTVKTLKKGAYRSLRSTLGEMPEELWILLWMIVAAP